MYKRQRPTCAVPPPTPGRKHSAWPCESLDRPVARVGAFSLLVKSSPFPGATWLAAGSVNEVSQKPKRSQGHRLCSQGHRLCSRGRESLSLNTAVPAASINEDRARSSFNVRVLLFVHPQATMRSEFIRYPVLTTLLSVVNGVRVTFLHIRLPEYRL